MAVRHVYTSIDYLLKQNDDFLSRVFDTDGASIRKEILELKNNGDKYIGSENCQNFDPKTACRCGDEKSINIIRSNQNQIN